MQVSTINYRVLMLTSKMELTKRLSHSKDPKSYREGTTKSIKCLRWQYKIQRMSNSSNTLILAESEYGSNYANRSMPQKLGSIFPVQTFDQVHVLLA
jgi:hypothetical protein